LHHVSDRSYTTFMEVELRPDQEAKLNEIAETTGRGTDDLIREAVDRLLGYDEWFKQEVQIGLDALKRGEVIPHEEIEARIDRWLEHP
jgi:predicted transcriptional regulator